MSSPAEVIAARNALRLELLRKAQDSKETVSLTNTLKKCKISIGLLIPYSATLALSKHGAQVVKTMIAHCHDKQLLLIGEAMVAYWALFDAAIQCKHGIEVLMELLTIRPDDSVLRSALAKDIVEKTRVEFWMDNHYSLPVLDTCFPLVSESLQLRIIQAPNFLPGIFKRPPNSSIVPPMIKHLIHNKPHIMSVVNPWIFSQMNGGTEFFIREMTGLILFASPEFATCVLRWMLWYDKLFGLKEFMVNKVKQSYVALERRVLITRVVVATLLERNTTFRDILDDPDTVDFIVRAVDMPTREKLAAAVKQRTSCNNKWTQEFAEFLCFRLTSTPLFPFPIDHSYRNQEKSVVVIDLEEEEEERAADDDPEVVIDENELGHTPAEVDLAIQEALEAVATVDGRLRESSPCPSPLPSPVSTMRAIGGQTNAMSEEVMNVIIDSLNVVDESTRRFDVFQCTLLSLKVLASDANGRRVIEWFVSHGDDGQRRQLAAAIELNLDAIVACGGYDRSIADFLLEYGSTATAGGAEAAEPSPSYETPPPAKRIRLDSTEGASDESPSQSGPSGPDGPASPEMEKESSLEVTSQESSTATTSPEASASLLKPVEVKKEPEEPSTRTSVRVPQQTPVEEMEVEEPSAALSIAPVEASALQSLVEVKMGADEADGSSTATTSPEASTPLLKPVEVKKEPEEPSTRTSPVEPQQTPAEVRELEEPSVSSSIAPVEATTQQETIGEVERESEDNSAPSGGRSSLSTSSVEPPALQSPVEVKKEAVEEPSTPTSSVESPTSPGEAEEGVDELSSGDRSSPELSTATTTSSEVSTLKAVEVKTEVEDEEEIQMLDVPKVVEAEDDDDDVQIIEVPKSLSSLRHPGVRPLLSSSSRRLAKPAEAPLDEEQKGRQRAFMAKLNKSIASECTIFKFAGAALLSGRVPRPVEAADRISESAATLCARSEGGLNLVVLVAEKWPHTRLNMSLAVAPLLQQLCVSGSGRRLLRHLLDQKTKQCFANKFFLRRGASPFLLLLNEEQDLADDVFDLAERSLKETFVKAHKGHILKTKHGVEFFRVLEESGLIPDLMIDTERQGESTDTVSQPTVSALPSSTVPSSAVLFVPRVREALPPPIIPPRFPVHRRPTVPRVTVRSGEVTVPSREVTVPSGEEREKRRADPRRALLKRMGLPF